MSTEHIHISCAKLTKHAAEYSLAAANRIHSNCWGCVVWPLIDSGDVCFATYQSHLGEASLNDYFEKEYKQGGVFKHEDYEHDAEDWCWVHKGSGIKVRIT